MYMYIYVHFGIAYNVKYWVIAFYMQYPKGVNQVKLVKTHDI